jgi:hypothetical protein
MCDFAFLIASSNALLDTAFGASNTKCRSDGLVTICWNSGRDTLVFSGSSIYCIIRDHSNYGPYQHRLPWCVEALLTYIHKFLFVYGGGVVTGTVCTSGVLVSVVCYGFGMVVIFFVGSIGCCGLVYCWVVVCYTNVWNCFY